MVGVVLVVLILARTVTGSSSKRTILAVLVRVFAQLW